MASTNLWHDIPFGENAPDTFNTIIEIQSGSSNKYEIDKETGLIKLDRVLYGSQYYPFDYGFIPRTLWSDGDALDVLVITSFPLLPGILVEVRPIGVLEMIDGGELDDKVIAVPAHDPRNDHILDIHDLGEHRLKEIDNFFTTYKMLQHKEVSTNGFKGVEETKKVILKGIEMYKEKYAQ